MASANSLHSDEQFLCSICLDVFTDPITTPCGHNYCNTCITHYWDTNDVCQCPLCQKKFYKKPEFSVNKVLAEMADQFRKSKQLKRNSNTDQEPAEPDEVSCDICTEFKLKALKSCLVCLISYCETHLEPHQRVAALKRHKLIDPVKNLEDIMCKKHDRPLELFCKTDHMCVCQFCTESDHKLHQVVSLEEEYEGKKAELGNMEAEVQHIILERQLKIYEVKHAVELSKKDADREMADSVQVFTTLMSCIEKSQAELIDVIDKKKKTTEKQAEGFIKELQWEITELKKRSSELKQLSHTEDQLQLLQNFTSINTPPPTKDWTKVNVHQSSYVGTVRTAVAQLEKTLSQEMEKLRDAELRRIQQYAVDVTLDPDTALLLPVDGTQGNLGNVQKNLQSFSSGKCYHEVQVKGKTDWSIGVTRASINRERKATVSADDGYWIIMLRNGNECTALADPPVLLPVREEVQKVGVFVDYEEGLVSFYDVEARVHLYSFTGCIFTEEINPFFSPLLNNDELSSDTFQHTPDSKTTVATSHSPSTPQVVVSPESPPKFVFGTDTLQKIFGSLKSSPETVVSLSCSDAKDGGPPAQTSPATPAFRIPEKDSSSPWANIEAKVFAPKNDGEEEGSDEEDASNNDIHFEPIVSLPEVETKSGEEEEEILFKERTKLYRWDQDINQWKERGVGDIKILFHPVKHFYRVLMRREQVLRVCANHTISQAMELKPMKSSANALVWTATDYTEGKGRIEQLAAKFKTPEVAETFRKTFCECQKRMGQDTSDPSYTHMSRASQHSRETNPLVFLTVAADGQPLGTVTVELFSHVVPKTAENFRVLCTGERGYGFRNSTFHRVIPDFMCQGGDITNHDGTGGKSIYGGAFEDENFDVRHTSAGLLSMANKGRNTNSSQFYVTLTKTEHLDFKHVVFGWVREGMDVVRQMGTLGTKSGKPSKRIVITDCGQL